jgi:hypothetical protein
MEKKLYKCKNCGKEVPIRSKGLCPLCRQKQRQTEGTLPKRKPIRKKFPPKSRDTCLEGYFEYHIEVLNSFGKSMETFEPIYAPTMVNVCHIFPKSKYKSVQCNLANCVYLTWEQHTRFDILLDKFDFEKLEKEFPNTWKTVIDKVKVLIPLVREQGKLLSKFKEYIND